MFLKRFTMMLAILLISCSAIPEKPTSQAKATTKTAHVSPSPMKKTATDAPFVEAEPTETSKPTVDPHRNCIDIGKSPQKDSLVKGTLVLIDPDYPKIYMLDMPSLERKLVYESDLTTNVATNEQYFAFATARDVSSHLELQVRDIHGEIVRQIPWKENWFGVVAWVNDAELLISSPYQKKIPVTAHKVNPFTNTDQELSSDFPGIYLAYPPANWEEYMFVETVYHPALDYVIYPLYDESSPVVVWDIEAEISVLTFSTYISYGRTPKWSPDGRSFIINASVTPELKVMERLRKQELFQIGLDGEIRQLTHYSETKSRVEFGNFSWSPDGQSIAFWVKTSPGPLDQEVDHVAILDLLSDEVIDYCVSGIRFGRNTATPIWAQDGKHLIVETRNEDQTSTVLLIDLKNQIAGEITHDLIPVGLLEE